MVPPPEFPAQAILSASEAHTRSVIGISDRTLALWVAENALVAHRHGAADAAQTVEMGGQSWRVATTLAPTTDEKETIAKP